MRLSLSVSVLATVLVCGAHADGGKSARQFLSMTFELSRADIARLDAGHVFSHTLDTIHGREVATLGIVRIATPPEEYVRRATDIVTFKRTEDVFEIGKFSDRPSLRDVASLSLDEGDVRRLQSCRIDDCDVRMSADLIQQFASAVDWRAADAGQRANTVMRRVLIDYVTRYLEVGPDALMEYADARPRLNVRDEFASLVDADRITWPHVGDLRRHLLQFPQGAAGATDFIYWSKERVHTRPVISATHVVIMPMPDDSMVRYAIASKQIYAMHYFDASLGLTLLVRDETAASPTTFVIYLNRSRIDLFDGVFGSITRRIVSGKARSLVAAQLGRLQRTFADSNQSTPTTASREKSGSVSVTAAGVPRFLQN